MRLPYACVRPTQVLLVGGRDGQEGLPAPSRATPRHSLSKRPHTSQRAASRDKPEQLSLLRGPRAASAASAGGSTPSLLLSRSEQPLEGSAGAPCLQSYRSHSQCVKSCQQGTEAELMLKNICRGLAGMSEERSPS